ncbi:long-chain fatty acid--CoA ligase [Priestia taiwanensis]|uniref:Long-chain-fatty-acid--CoA ligase n=1 Tax=Priestia taiwanensis TaxID=1347902 RepID=A0A917EM94_9BACI|nr:long-chain fatty acid--CoA ligase [Priestia taiwanensis]MBM7362250.1 fatty-acyl-CoA synthase [Priestia taiwanensis]GGE60654.1 long-chain-fatty-acid--CoA ligase [Priestia taiwanensis]
MMMNMPFSVPAMLEHAEKYFGKKYVVSRTSSGVTKITYKEISERTRRLASALTNLGIQKRERVGTFAWNHHRHLEAYFGIPGAGGVLHTVNIRLSPQHIVYVINHAEDTMLLIDEELLPLIENVQDQLTTVHTYIVMTDRPELPETTLKNVYHYEHLLQKGDPNFQFVEVEDENDPVGMCYTSATTGNPKGVVYTHRSTCLHSYGLGLVDTAAICERDVAMAVVPMFHANAWGMPYACVWFGSTLVLPGPMFTPKILLELIQEEKVTLAAGVPTIWIGLLQELERQSYDTSSLRAVLCGGSAAPKGMIDAFVNKHHIPFIHAFGMTETSPLATVSRLKAYQQGISMDEQLSYLTRQGFVAPGLEIKAIGQNGEIAWDGKEMGELLIRGHWIAAEYYNDERSEGAFENGWFYTGDVVTIDEEGSIKIVDRMKDMIKSGGEWISSVDLENVLMGHPAVLEAAVIGVPHDRWQERPIACVVLKEGVTVSKEELIEYLVPSFAKWWLPDEVVFMNEIPRTSVGKFLKKALREQLNNHFVS